MNKEEKEIRKLRAKLRESLKKTKCLEADVDNLEKQIDSLVCIASHEKKVKIVPVGSSDKRSGVPIILASDWHIESQVNRNTVNGMNHYDKRVAYQRVARFCKATKFMLDFYESIYDVKSISLCLLGDFITGHIQDDDIRTNNAQPMEATLTAKSYLSATINFILDNSKVEHLYVHCIHGNHSRITAKKMHSSSAGNSLEWLLYNVLADEFAENERVEFQIACGEMGYFAINDHIVRFLHGDQIGYRDGVGGISIPLSKYIAKWDTQKHAEITAYGHHHSYLVGPNFIGNGSLVGWTPFSSRGKYRYEPARQAICMIDAREGMTLASPLWIQKSGEEEGESK